MKAVCRIEEMLVLGEGVAWEELLEDSA